MKKTNLSKRLLKKYLLKAGVLATFSICSLSAFAQLPSPILPEKTTRVSEHVFMVTGFPNVVFVVGDSATLIIDTGLGIEQGTKMANVAKGLSHGKKFFLTTTHFHPEHAAGVQGFPSGTMLIRPNSQQQELEREGQKMIDIFRSAGGEFKTALVGVKAVTTPDITFEKELRINLGGVYARLFWLGPAHTAGDELILVENDKVLVSGDVVQNKVVPVASSPKASLTNWINILDQLEQLDIDQIVPTHSRIGNRSLITDSRAFIIDMRSRALLLKKNGISAAEASIKLTAEFKRDYPEWAKNTDWDNVNDIPAFVKRVYLEADSPLVAE